MRQAGHGPEGSVDRLALGLAAVACASLGFLPFVEVRASRIASGHGHRLLDAVPLAVALPLLAAVVVCVALATRTTWRRTALVASLAGLGVLLAGAGWVAAILTPEGNRVLRVSLGSGFWVCVLAVGLLATSGLARARLVPLARVLLLGAALGCAALALRVGLFDHLSILREYAVNETSFGREARTHVVLAFGSLAAALVVGLPLGMACHRLPALRGAVLQALNLVQTIPSIALFGLLMVPLGALASRYAWVGEAGIHGIGAAPAMVALFLYSLLPVVANTSLGLARVSPVAVDAARGMGYTAAQVLAAVELPLALPAILTGVRIVLVQNIGLATIAALIGGGGFGTFVFQGVGQTAIDLVLLGAIPTVVLAFCCAVILDAAIDGLRGGEA